MKKVGLGNGLGYFILRDGTMYFLAKLLIGVIGTILFFIPASDTLGSWIGVLTSISHPLTYSITNRLVLNLRQVSHLQERNEPAIGTIQEPAFATNSLLGNLGAPLRVGPDEDDEIEQIGVDSEVEVGEEYGSVDDNRITEEFRDISDV
ncbi:hypothetical protein BD410DRAFT_449565 [Rickenella mellea]|uniref:Uncharacterized protein n=1 Tax=Rickenella mellea TaxID=50990 RepID=A0A4Y7PVZ0_9AGAM|nr:hypothetical protein BD410DRAFT_449565 [Rickenella mellea]